MDLDNMKPKQDVKLRCPFCDRIVSKTNIDKLTISNILKVVAGILEKMSKK